MNKEEEEWCHYSNLPSPLSYQNVLETILPIDNTIDDVDKP